ncbi:MAG: flippase [bacterium]
MRLSTKIAYNTIVQIASKIIATILGLVAVGIITRYLGAAGYGKYTTIITFLSFFAILADMGLTLVTVQMISRDEKNEEKILGNLLAFRLVTAFLIIGAAPVAILFFPYSQDIKTGAAIGFFSFLFIALNQILVGFFQKKLRMDKVAIAEISGRIVLVGSVFTAFKLDLGLFGIVASTVLGSLVSFIIQYYFSRSFARVKLLFDFGFWREIIKKSWPLAITITLNLIYLKTDILFLSIIPRNSELGINVEVGLYGAAYKMLEVLVALPFMFAGIILPVLSTSWHQNDKQKFRRILQKSFDLMCIFAIPLCFGVQPIAEKIIVLVAGKEFVPAGAILQLLMISIIPVFLGNILAHAIIAINQVKKSINAYAFTAVTSVIGYFIFIPAYNVFGAAWVTIYSETVIALSFLYLIRKYAGFFPNLKVLLKSIVASLFMLIFIYFIYNNNLMIIISGGAFVYIATLYLLNGITKNDVMDLLNKENK